MVPPETSRPPATARCPRILFVDDNADARDLYTFYLGHVGFEVHEARDGGEALDRAVALRPDLIVMDLVMPDMDGWQATRRLKADPRTEGIPVLVLTAHTAIAEHYARDAGADGYLTKPRLPEELHREIRRLLKTG